MTLSKKDKEYLDSLDDETFISLITCSYSTKVPVIEKCTKEEYEEHEVDITKLSTDEIIKFIEREINSNIEYRRIPYWNSGGGILDQISGKEPDGYRYEKIVGYEDVLMMGSDMIEYCQTRECMKPFFEEQNIKEDEQD